jgi:thiamine biosynthesis lipoprotein
MHRLATQTADAMGSPLRLTVPVCEMRIAWPLVRGIFASTEHDLTRFDASGPLSVLNRASGSPRFTTVSPGLMSALITAHRAHRLSDGLFDPRIIGALESAGESAGIDLPSSPTLLRPGERWLQLRHRRMAADLAAPVDLGGIGKGLALRQAARALHAWGITTFLIEAGGDLVAGGPPGNEAGWRIALRDPAARDPIAVIELHDTALATSSTARRRWASPDGSIAHHLIDPRTLKPAVSRLRCVTVLASDPAWAEVRAKVELIRGDLDGLVRGASVWWLTNDGKLGMTRAAEARTVWRQQAARLPEVAAAGILRDAHSTSRQSA